MTFKKNDLSYNQATNHTSDPDPQRTQNFINRIKNFEGIRIPLKTLLELFSDIFSPRPREVESRRWLLAALEQASAENVIRIPPKNGKRWERSLHPPIPLSVDRIVPPATPPVRPWQYFPWHPKIAWIGDMLRLAPQHEAFLLRVHKGLVNDEFSQLAPLKRRSLELTGDEKRLGSLLRTTLFKKDRLSLNMLGCVPNYPQLAMEKVSDKPKIIVFENIEPFRVAYKVLRSMQNPPYGMVAYGAGMSFSRSITTLTEHAIEFIEYVGDIDQPGLQIVRSAKLRAYELGLPTIIPAVGIHRTMIDISHRFEKPLGFTYRKSKNTKIDHKLLEWLPSNTQSDILNVLNAGNRIAEEILSEVDLRALWENSP